MTNIVIDIIAMGALAAVVAGMVASVWRGVADQTFRPRFGRTKGKS